MAAPISQIPKAPAKNGTRCATTDGTKKIDAPIVPPTTTPSACHGLKTAGNRLLATTSACCVLICELTFTIP